MPNLIEPANLMGVCNWGQNVASLGEMSVFLWHKPRAVLWHQSLNLRAGFTASPSKCDQLLERDQGKRLPKTTWKYMSSLQTWFSTQMTYFITFSVGAPDQRKPQHLFRLLIRMYRCLITSFIPRSSSLSSILLWHGVWISVYSLSSRPTRLFFFLSPWSWSPSLCCRSNFLFTTIQPSIPMSLLPLSPSFSASNLRCVISFWRPFWFVLFVCFCFFCWTSFDFLASSVITLFSFSVASPLLAACLKLFHEPMHDSNHTDFKWSKVWYDSFLSVLFFKRMIPFWFTYALYFPICSSDSKYFTLIPPPPHFLKKILQMFQVLVLLQAKHSDRRLNRCNCASLWTVTWRWSTVDHRLRLGILPLSPDCCYASQIHHRPKGAICLFWGFTVDRLCMDSLSLGYCGRFLQQEPLSRCPSYSQFYKRCPRWIKKQTCCSFVHLRTISSGFELKGVRRLFQEHVGWQSVTRYHRRSFRLVGSSTYLRVWEEHGTSLTFIKLLIEPFKDAHWLTRLLNSCF